MKLLLDEQMPRKIAKHFEENVTVDHVQLVGWSGIKNGELLKLAAAEGYDALAWIIHEMRKAAPTKSFRIPFSCSESCSDWASPSEIQSVFRSFPESATEKGSGERIRRFMNSPG